MFPLINLYAEEQKMTDLSYSPLQEKAIDKIVEWYGDSLAPQEFYLAGFAGTGKSTVVEEAKQRIRSLYNVRKIAIGAYTGKAAHVLRKKGNPEAQTIHSMIYTTSEVEVLDVHGNVMGVEMRSILNPIGPAAEASLIILDECSMIDEQMANDLRSFGHKILVMGDPGQLPPINGEGSFTNRNPDFFLDEIHRQAADSPIIELATMARRGIMPPAGYKKGNVQVLQLTNGTAQEFLHNPDTQILCGLNRIRWAVTQLMRKELGFRDTIPMAGEKILACKNNKNEGFFNGSSGYLKKLEMNKSGDWILDAEIENVIHQKLITDPYLFFQHFDNGASKRNFTKKGRNEFDWGYVWSVHKAQGSGWPHVTLIDNSESFRENRWKHLYTGLTRAESGLTVLVS